MTAGGVKALCLDYSMTYGEFESVFEGGVSVRLCTSTPTGILAKKNQIADCFRRACPFNWTSSERSPRVEANGRNGFGEARGPVEGQVGAYALAYFA